MDSLCDRAGHRAGAQLDSRAASISPAVRRWIATILGFEPLRWWRGGLSLLEVTENPPAAERGRRVSKPDLRQWEGLQQPGEF